MELMRKMQNWGNRWFLRGDFNDILEREKKHGGKRRLEFSFKSFRDFVEDMRVQDLGFKERRWTWENNREGEDFVEERLDGFFGSSEWILECPDVEVTHIPKQASNHSLIVLDTQHFRMKN